MGILDCLDRSNQKHFLELHNILVRVNPAHLHVNRDELGRVTRGKGWVGTEHRSDFEYLAQAGHHRHLLIELRALSQVGVTLEVFKLE